MNDMKHYIKSAHWPFLCYEIAGNRISKKLALFCGKKMGYGVQVSDPEKKFVALYVDGTQLYFFCNGGKWNVSEKGWHGELLDKGPIQSEFRLWKDQDLVVSVDFKDKYKNKKDLADPHFLSDIVDWLSTEKSKGSFIHLING